MKPDTPTKTELVTLIQDLSDTLARYGQHDENCLDDNYHDGPPLCTCGFAVKILNLDERVQKAVK